MSEIERLANMIDAAVRDGDYELASRRTIELLQLQAEVDNVNEDN